MEKDLISAADTLAGVSKGLEILGDSLHPSALILECNVTTSLFGLTLTPAEAQGLTEARADALARTGRIEFGPCITQKIILEFCDSPWLSQDTYAETLGELTQIFYYFKNELELIPDDELMGRMKKYFDGVCSGSVEHLNHVLERMVHDLRYGCGYDVDLSCGPDGFGEEDSDE